MRILHVRFELPLGRHERGAQAGAGDVPRLSAIARAPHAATRDSDEDVARIARIHADRMNAGMISAAAEPLFAARIVP